MTTDRLAGAAIGRLDEDQAHPRLECPLAVDLDGTLVWSDTLHEGLIGLVKARPGAVVALCGALRHGKAAFKRHVATAMPFAPAALPYNLGLLAFLHAEKRAGRQVGLFTAADQSVADAVAGYLGLFDVVRGSDAATNLSGIAKATAIEASFGPQFAYAGDAKVDWPIFARAESVVLAGRVERLMPGLAKDAVIEARFPSARMGLATWVNALRLHHWVKNALVFVAAILSSAGPAEWLQAALLFMLLGVVASATYIINDLLDLASDRNHPQKRFRPFAAGLIPAWQGIAVAGLLTVGALLLASLILPWGCTAILSAYLAITLSYSLVLKRIPMVDVTVLAGLFTLRVLAGSLVVSTQVSPWLLTFSMLFFLGLALIKRYAELHRVVQAAPDATARSYTREDLPLLMTSGLASGFSAIVIAMIYLITEQYPRAVYGQPGALWGAMPILLVWTLRLWHLAIHGRMNEDPVIFAIKDRLSLALSGTLAFILLAARSF